MDEPTEAQIMQLRETLTKALIPIFGMKTSYALFIRNEDGSHCMSNMSDEGVVKLSVDTMLGMIGRTPDLEITITEPDR